MKEVKPGAREEARKEEQYGYKELNNRCIVNANKITLT